MTALHIIQLCAACSAGVANGDWTHIDYHFNGGDADEEHARIIATLETLGYLTPLGSHVDGYGDCYLCDATEVDPDLWYTGDLPTLQPCDVAHAHLVTLAFAVTWANSFDRAPAVDGNDRGSILHWLQWNDRNGCYRDPDAATELHGVFDLDGARAMLQDICARCALDLD